MLTVYKKPSATCFPKNSPAHRRLFSPADPTFIHVHLIPDSAERNDDKLYFFFREKSSEMGQSPVTQSRIGRICLVCTQRQECLFCFVNIMKRKPGVRMRNRPESPEASRPLRLSVYGRGAGVWPTLMCWNPHVSLTFPSTMHPSVCEADL